MITGEEAVEPADSTNPVGKTVVNALNLSTLIIAPVVGAEPNPREINETQYTGTVAWQTIDGELLENGPFGAGTVYQAVLTLEATENYTFEGFAANRFTCVSATAITNAAGSGEVTITFPATLPVSIELIALTERLFPAPVAGELPQAEIDDDGYKGRVIWIEQSADGDIYLNNKRDEFAMSTTYKAIVTLDTKTGYSFIEDVPITYYAPEQELAITSKTTASVAFSTVFRVSDDKPISIKVVEFTGVAQNETINLTNTASDLSWKDPNSSLQVSVPNTFDSYAWYVDGISLSVGTTYSVTIKAQEYSLGSHTVSVRVTKGANSYSKNAHFTIKE
jgi:hypothetical protein